MAGRTRQTMQPNENQQIQYDTLKVRLYPTEGQKILFQKTFDCCRYIWNQMLSDQQKFYFETDAHFIPTPAKYKKTAPFLSEVDNQVLTQEYNRLTQAFRLFFKQPERFGHPQFKRKKDDRDSFTAYNCFSPSGSTLYLTRDGVRMTKAGVVKARFSYRPQSGWELKRITVERTRSGQYFGYLLYGHVVRRPHPVGPTAETTVGVMHSPRHFYVTDGGTKADPPNWSKAAEPKLKRMQQRLARMQYGSRNYMEQVQKYRRLQEHVANQRRDYLHKESTRIANEWNGVCIRSDTPGTQFDGFGMFREMLQYKLERRGKALLLVDCKGTAAQSCSACGLEWNDPGQCGRTCPKCGTALDREENEARNIKAFGIANFIHAPQSA